MAIHTNLPIYRDAYRLFDVVMELQKNMPREFKPSVGFKLRDECIEILTLVFRANTLQRIDQVSAAESLPTINSYFGLARQATASHYDRARIANVARRRGHSVKADFTKAYRRSA